MFAAPIRERGAGYYERDAVQQFKWQHDGFVANVEGTRQYRVAVREMTSAKPKFDCSCPHFAQGVNCKHLWAAILLSAYKEGELDDHLDRKGSPTTEEAALPSRKITEVPTAASAPSSSQASGEPSGKPPWMRHFRKIQEPVPGASKPRRSESRGGTEATVKNEVRYRLSLNEPFIGNKLSVHLEWRRASKSGGWGRWQNFAVGPRSANKPSSSSDREMIALLLQAGHTEPPLSDTERWRTFSTFEIPSLLFSFMLPKLCATEAAWLDVEPNPGPSSEPHQRALWFRSTIPYQFELSGSKVRRGPGDSIWRVTGGLALSEGDQKLHEDAAPYAVSDVLWVHDSGLVATDDGSLVIGKLDPVDIGWLSVLQREGDLEAPLSQTDDLIAELYGVKLPKRVSLPPELTVAERLGKPIPVLRLAVTAPSQRSGNQRSSSQGLGGNDPMEARRVSFSLCFDYGDRLIQADDGAPGWFSQSREQIIRDVDLENRFVAELEALLGKEHLGSNASTWLTRGQGATLAYRTDALISNLVQGLSEEWLVEMAGQQVFRSAVPQFRVGSNIDWFELDKKVTLETSAGQTEVSLPALLKAVKRGTSVQIAGGQAFLDRETAAKIEAMSSLLGKQLTGAGAQAGAEDSTVRVEKSQLLVLDALLQSGDAEAVKLQLDETCERLRDSLATFEGVEPRQEPAEFTGDLREYQRFGLGWMEFLRQTGLGGCLADDMGLGKTVQVLALLQGIRLAASREEREPKPFLVVAPKSVVPNWVDEIRRFCPGMPVIDFTGTGRKKRLDALKFQTESTVVVTTYGLMRNDLARLLEWDFDTIILDEAQAIKNPTSKTARAARQLKGSHRLALTGTPVENHLGDAVSIFQFLNPGMVENLPALRALAHPQDDDASLELASMALRPLVLRRRKEEVLTELPEKTEQTLYCDLSTAERRHYDELAAHYRDLLLENKAKKAAKSAKDDDGALAASPVDDVVAEAGGSGGTPNKIVALEALLRLRQAACHQGLLGQGPQSSKLDLLDARIEELLADPGHKALIFSQFTSLLAFVKERFDQRGWKYAYLDGKTRKRKDVIAGFQEDPDCRLFLISLKAGGVGLNLTAADYVFLLDPWWNPAAEAQAVDRAHRIGQTKPVVAYRLLARNTVEERVAALQQKKRELAAVLLGSDKGLVAEMTAEDLELLLS